ncbi:hypothetical protein GGF31_003466 [Allomyces arbusculus]|nr:hypothetical protein GGF31_003466 [Allomyces arbusculus]
MRNYVKEHADKLENAGIAIIPLYPERIESPEELGLFEQRAIDDGFEGIIVRSPNSPYKCGRSTIKQAWMLKVKQFVDDEAEIIGFDELMHNENKAFADERGKNGIEFNIGTGFSADERKRLWDTRNHHIGKLVKYKYFPIGVKDAPRHPVFLGFRDKDDM